MNEAAQSSTGDPAAALSEFYQRALGEVFRYFYRGTAGDRLLTEDLTQETFLACVRAAKAGQPDALTMPWLMGVARHKLVDQYRRHSLETRKLSLIGGTAEPESAATFDVTSADALGALQRLSGLHRLVLVLRYVDDLAVAAVASALGRSVRATESLLVRARQSLTEELGRSDHA